MLYEDELNGTRTRPALDIAQMLGRNPVCYPTCLRPPYEMPGTDVLYDATGSRVRPVLAGAVEPHNVRGVYSSFQYPAAPSFGIDTGRATTRLNGPIDNKTGLPEVPPAICIRPCSVIPKHMLLRHFCPRTCRLMPRTDMQPLVLPGLVFEVRLGGVQGIRAREGGRKGSARERKGTGGKLRTS